MHYVIAGITGLSVAFIGSEYADSTIGVIMTGGSSMLTAWVLSGPDAAAYYDSLIRGGKV